MATRIEQRLGTQGPDLNNLIRLPDPDKPRPVVKSGTRPSPNK